MRRPSLDAVRGFDRAVYVVALGQLVNVFGAGLVYPFATVHFHFRVGIALAVVGLGLGAKSVTTAVGTVVGGYLADAVGRKPVMVASMALSAIALAAFAVVPGLAAALPAGVAGAVGVSPLGLAFVGVCVVSGLVGGLYTPAASAMTADLTDDGERDRGYALLKVANNTGFGAGFVVGGVLYSVASVAVFVGDGLTSGVVAVLLLLFVPRVAGENAADAGAETTGSAGSDGRSASGLAAWWRAATRPRVLALAALNLGFALMYAQMQTTVPVVAKQGLGLTASQLGTLYVLNPLTIVALQIPLVSAVDGWRRTRGLMVSACLWAASMLSAWGADALAVPAGAGLTVPLVLLGVGLVGGHLVVRTLGEILHAPLASALMSDLGTTAERGTQLSVLETAKRLGIGLGSFAGGLFFDYGVSHLLWPALVAVCLLLVVGLAGLERAVTPGENGAYGDATGAGAD
ncbi:MFS transporter [Candidatus Halobonum tyrrellensis]|uniref:Major facilitator superfamily protein n=1 Tax=Candidatus Halobonum tyrrellensis G22 TaxID=1324957 RepID=V4HC76_9EURY|nr:MFS transporter [Candidatus Halobonum tyrrellensis]ESP87663.1 major facilitator superfamily protein [Candidatus Halobonum tyrrellensis G22]